MEEVDGDEDDHSTSYNKLRRRDEFDNDGVVGAITSQVPQLT